MIAYDFTEPITNCFIYFCLVIYFAYYNAKIFTNITALFDLTRKQQAHFLAIISSSSLSLISMFFLYKFYNAGFSYQMYLLNINVYEYYISFVSISYFTSYLISDIIVGSFYYHEYLLSLSGYTHHIIYIFINTSMIYYDVHTLYILFFISEMPTFLLSLGSFNSNLRNDKLFGLTFFLTRIVYHSSLTVLLYSYKLSVLFGSLSTILHIYWFANWFKKYA
jgi:hypothetical protein